ncbi:MAG: DNA gyrase inhibitor YacG [Planctomycetaceae bacterium]
MIRPQTCPICDTELATNAATQSPLFPFCSKRCKMIDLYRWTEGKYAVVDLLTPERLLDEMAGFDPDVPDPEL